MIGTFFLLDGISSSNKILFFFSNSSLDLVDSGLDLGSVGLFTSNFQLDLPDIEKHVVVLKLSFSDVDVNPIHHDLSVLFLSSLSGLPSELDFLVLFKSVSSNFCLLGKSFVEVGNNSSSDGGDKVLIISSLSILDLLLLLSNLLLQSLDPFGSVV